MIFFITIILAYFGLHVWIFRALLSEISPLPFGFRLGISIIFWLMSVGFFGMMLLRDKSIPLCLGHALYWGTTGWLTFFLYVVILFALASLLRLFGVNIPHALAWCGGLVACILIYGFINFDNPAIKRINLRETSGNPLRIVAVSDVHLGYGITKSRFARYVDMINREKPDVILIAGDLIDMTVEPLERLRMQDEINRLRAPQGIYMCLGNHEYISGVDASIDFIRKTKITLLRDSLATLPSGHRIIGLDDYGHTRGIEKLMPDTGSSIVISHQPQNSSVDAIVAAGAKLAVFGHTHKGQFFPINLITRLVYNQDYGYQKRRKTHLYVSSGLGLWGPPFRIGTYGEIVVIDL